MTFTLTYSLLSSKDSIWKSKIKRNGTCYTSLGTPPPKSCCIHLNFYYFPIASVSFFHNRQGLPVWVHDLAVSCATEAYKTNLTLSICAK